MPETPTTSFRLSEPARRQIRELQEVTGLRARDVVEQAVRLLHRRECGGGKAPRKPGKSP